MPKHRLVQWLPTALMMIIPLVIITMLVKWSPDFNKETHGFTRVFMDRQPSLWKSMEVAPMSKYIAGIGLTDVYFSSIKAGEIERLDLLSGHTSSTSVVTDAALLNRLSASWQAEVDGHYVRLFDAPAGLIINTDMLGHEIEVHQLPELFTRFVSISRNRVFLRKFVQGERDQAFYKYDLQLEQCDGRMQLTDERTDGGLSTDGDLVYDQATGTLAYVEHNCNKMTLFDTTGEVLKVTHSIDTFATNRFQGQVFGHSGQGTITNSAPVQFVNQSASFDNGILYVQSGVRSDSERLSEFNRDVVIDRYDGKVGIYSGSIRLKRVKEGIRNWLVREQQLYLLSNNRLYIYNL